MKHTPAPISSDLQTALHEERHLLSNAQVPIATVSATYRKELLKKYHVFNTFSAEAIYSRAHYSMAEAVRQQALAMKLTTHVLDPLNFVATNDWGKVDFTQYLGQLIARHKALQWAKQKIDSTARKKLPFSEAIKPVLQYAFAKTKYPILSLHYEAGNALASPIQPIVQVVTDPHIRPQYLDPLADSTARISPNITFCVFDSETKTELLSKAKLLGKRINTKDIVVTGPPVDPRISILSKTRKLYKKGQPLHLAITTGGIGSNLAEIKQVLIELEPLLKQSPEKLRLFLYAGTHKDFRDFYETYAEKNNIRVGNIEDTTARIRILYEDSIVDANENLIKHMFPWAHGIITKPSGDMAYEAAAAGCFCLLLEPLGEWEVNIKQRFLKLGLAYELSAHKALASFTYFDTKNYFARAQAKAINLPNIYRQGAKKIVQVQQSMGK